MEENTPRIRKCLEQLNSEEVWTKPTASSNSVGNLMLHLCGNITQWIISTLGGKEDKRIRDKEFSATGGFTRDEFLKKMETTVSEAISVIRNLDPESLLKEYNVQIYHYTGLGIILHVVEHYSYHNGQIAFWTKLFKNKDLAFYNDNELNRNRKSE